MKPLPLFSLLTLLTLAFLPASYADDSLPVLEGLISTSAEAVADAAEGEGKVAEALAVLVENASEAVADAIASDDAPAEIAELVESVEQVAGYVAEAAESADLPADLIEAAESLATTAEAVAEALDQVEAATESAAVSISPDLGEAAKAYLAGPNRIAEVENEIESLSARLDEAKLRKEVAEAHFAGAAQDLKNSVSEDNPYRVFSANGKVFLVAFKSAGVDLVTLTAPSLD